MEAPLCIDSTEADVIRVALEQSPGARHRELHQPGERPRADATPCSPHVAAHGAAVIALTIDRDLGGMCKTADTKLEAARKIHAIAVDEYGLQPDALIFDALTFTLATGDEEFRRSAAGDHRGHPRHQAPSSRAC